MSLSLQAFYRAPWLLPTFGAVAGTLTNYVALAMIFYPFRPTPLCPPWAWPCCRCRDTRGSDGLADESANADMTARGASVSGAKLAEPQRPRGCCVMQGLFIRRQAEVAAVYADIVANALITPRDVLDELLRDRDSLKAICRRRTLEASSLVVSDGIEPAVAGTTGGTSPAAPASPLAAAIESLPSWLLMLRRAVAMAASVIDTATGDTTAAAAGGDGAQPAPGHLERMWDAARQTACDVVVERMPDALAQSEAYVGTAMRLEETVRERMGRLPPEQFELLLHSVFRDDEWKLVLLGGVLGAALGAAQAYTFAAVGMT